MQGISTVKINVQETKKIVNESKEKSLGKATIEVWKSILKDDNAIERVNVILPKQHISEHKLIQTE